MESVGYARDFARLLVRVLDVGDDPSRILEPLRRALTSENTIPSELLDEVIAEAMQPSQRFELTTAEIRAVGARFGSEAAEAMRAAQAQEPGMKDFSDVHGSADALLLLDGIWLKMALQGCTIHPTPKTHGFSQEKLGTLSASLILVFRGATTDSCMNYLKLVTRSSILH